MLFEWSKDAQIALHTSIVVIADIMGEHLDQFLLAGKAFAVVALALQNAPETLHRTVINALSYTRHTLDHSCFLYLVVEYSVCILKPSIGMEDGVSIWICLHRLVKGLENKRVVVSASDNERDNAPVIQVQNGTQIHPVRLGSFIPLELSYIGQPLLVGGLGMEVSV